MRLRTLILGLTALLTPMAAQAKPIAPKVLVVTLFDGETAPWLKNVKLPTEVKVPGLKKEFPVVHCNADLCVMTTGMGFANAATSVMAVAMSGQFDLTKTYIYTAGIAGIDPNNGTLGSAAWADYVVDAGLFHEIDSREAPKNWKSEIFELGTFEPGKPQKKGWGAGTEVYKLNPALVKTAYEATKNVKLADSKAAQDYRKLYEQKAARAKPAVTICATAAGDTYWHGKIIAEEIAQHVSLITGGKADYCTTQMEDNAVLTALTRAAQAGKVDLSRVADLRTGSDFDRPHKGQAAIDSFKASDLAYPLAQENAYRVGYAFAKHIIANWNTFKNGIK